MTGVKAFILKPNLLVPYSATQVGVNCLYVSGAGTSTMTVDAAPANIKPTTALGPFGDTRTDWLYIFDGAHVGKHFRITGVTGNAISIDGTVPACAGTDHIQIFQSVDARCAWTNVTAVLYFDCEATEIQMMPKNDLIITHAANRLTVIVNVNNFSGTGAIVSMFLGNRNDSPDTAGQVELFWDYAGSKWQSTTPKYSRLYRYTYPTGTVYTKGRKLYNYTTMVAEDQRIIPRHPQVKEDSFNNLTLDQLELELL